MWSPQCPTVLSVFPSDESNTASHSLATGSLLCHPALRTCRPLYPHLPHCGQFPCQAHCSAPDLAASVPFMSVAFEELLCWPLLLSYHCWALCKRTGTSYKPNTRKVKARVPNFQILYSKFKASLGYLRPYSKEKDASVHLVCRCAPLIPLIIKAKSALSMCCHTHS